MRTREKYVKKMLKSKIIGNASSEGRINLDSRNIYGSFVDINLSSFSYAFIFS